MERAGAVPEHDVLVFERLVVHERLEGERAARPGRQPVVDLVELVTEDESVGLGEDVGLEAEVLLTRHDLVAHPRGSVGDAPERVVGRASQDARRLRREPLGGPASVLADDVVARRGVEVEVEAPVGVVSVIGLGAGGGDGSERELGPDAAVRVEVPLHAIPVPPRLGVRGEDQFGAVVLDRDAGEVTYVPAGVGVGGIVVGLAGGPDGPGVGLGEAGEGQDGAIAHLNGRLVMLPVTEA